MGDRGNIVIKEESGDGQVWLYTHWNGSQIKQMAQRALASHEGRERWTDEQYLARIVFCEMIKDDPTGESHGITSRIHDNEHAIVVIDVPRKEVYLVGESELHARRVPKDYAAKTGKHWSFNEYCDLHLEAQ